MHPVAGRLTLAVLALLAGCASQPSESRDGPSVEESATSARPLGDTKADRAFHRDLNAYCRHVQASQLNLEKRLGLSIAAYDRAQVQMAGGDAQLLKRMRPPARVAGSFAEFVAAERSTYVALIHVAASRPATSNQTSADFTEALDELNASVENRRRLGKELAASMCDGELPSTQEAAAIAALKSVQVATDPQQACVALVAPQFVHMQQWGSEPDPMAACVSNRIRRVNHPLGVATEIAVSKVTGADGLTASVHFRDVDGCCAGPTYVARLWFLHGKWKVARIDYR